ncbi:MAG: hypothetical protein IT371_23355, partial [Deltaproteobacteria bacterium]|nr:hypothetical protein [Deltaproteobacteria bacterium]
LQPMGRDAVRVTIPYQYFKYAALGQESRTRPLSFIVPVGVAEKLAKAATSGLKLFTAHDLWMGPQLRIVAGRGKSAVVVDRTSTGGENGQAGYGVVRVQLGLGQSAKAFFVGRTRDGKNLGRGTFTYGSGDWLLTHGVASIIDPVSLAVNTGAALNGRDLQWYQKVTTRKLTTNRAKALEAGGLEGTPGHFIHGGTVLTNAAAELKVAAPLAARFGL